MFWKPGTNLTTFQSGNISSDQPIKTNDGLLKSKNHLLYLIEQHSIMIVIDETRSIATQLPQYLSESGWTEEGYRIAIVTKNTKHSSTLLAEKMNSSLGRIGFVAPFEKVLAAYTRIIFCEFSFLLQELQRDPLLSMYSIIILDDIHQRSIEMDILMVLFLKIVKKRPEFRVVLVSAICDDRLVDYFNRESASLCNVLSLETRVYPVMEYFLEEPCKDYITETVETVFKIHREEGPGDILVFLTSREEVDTVVTLLSDRPLDNKEPILPFALLNGMSDQERMFAIQPSRPKSRKVVVSTAYAETVPLEGIIYVVDCGLVKLKVFSPETCVDSLVVVPTSESGASRRSGRAGRTRPGKCFRLYTEKEFKTSKLTDSLEIERGNLTNMVYYLKSIGVDNLLHFDYITPPNIAQLSQALCTLNDMGLMSEDGRLVPSVANLVSQLPIDIYLSSLIVKSIEFGCTQEAIIIVGMILVQSVFIESGNQTKSAIAKFKVQEGDLVSMINGAFD